MTLRARAAWVASAAAVCVGLMGCAHESVVWFGLNPTRTHRVEIVELAESDQRVRLDGILGASFLGIGVENLSWSADGKHLAYAAHAANGWFVVVDGKPERAYDGIGPIVWSPDGARVAYAALKGAAWHVVVDHVEGLGWYAVLADSLTWSPDSKRFAYAASDNNESGDGSSSGAGAHVHVVVDEKAVDTVAGVGDFRFSNDSAHFAYLCRDQNHSYVVIDGDRGNPYEGIASYSISDRADHVAFLARLGTGWYAMIDGVSRGPYDRATKVLLSADGSHSVYAVKQGSLEYIVRDGGAKIGASYDELLTSSVVMSEDGLHVAYAARKGAAWFVVKDATEFDHYVSVGAPRFGGEHVFFSARSALGGFIVEDGVAQTVYTVVGAPTPNSDGSSVAYIARMGPQMLIVKDGAETPVHFALEGTLAWSSAGGHLGAVVGQEDASALSFWIDGNITHDLDGEELAAVTMKPTEDDRLETSIDEGLLRRWVSAELKLGAGGRVDTADSKK